MGTWFWRSPRDVTLSREPAINLWTTYTRPPCTRPGAGCTNGRKCCRKVKSKNGLHHRCPTTCPNCLVLRTALTCGVSQVWCNPNRLRQNRCTNTTYDRDLRQKATCSGRWRKSREGHHKREYFGVHDSSRRKGNVYTSCADPGGPRGPCPPPPSPQNIAPPNSEARAKRALAPPGAKRALAPPYKILDPPMIHCPWKCSLSPHQTSPLQR